MTVNNDEPCYKLACLLNDVQADVATTFSLAHGTLGKDMDDTIALAKEELQRVNDLLAEVMPHLEAIKAYSYEDEQRSFEEMAEHEGQKPDQHIFLSLEALNSFIENINPND